MSFSNSNSLISISAALTLIRESSPSTHLTLHKSNKCQKSLLMSPLLQNMSGINMFYLQLASSICNFTYFTQHSQNTCHKSILYIDMKEGNENKVTLLLQNFQYFHSITHELSYNHQHHTCTFTSTYIQFQMQTNSAFKRKVSKKKLKSKPTQYLATINKELI